MSVGWRHVIMEQPQVMPPLADRYAPSAVVPVLVVGWIFTTHKHVSPNTIHGARPQPVLGKLIPVLATTTARCPDLDGSALRHGNGSAIAAVDGPVFILLPDQLSNAEDRDSTKSVPDLDGFAVVRLKPVISNVH